MLIGVFAKHPQLPFLDQAGVTHEAGGLFTDRLLRGESAADMVSDAMLDMMAIVGSPERCRENIAIAAGVISPVLFFPPPIDFERIALVPAIERGMRDGQRCWSTACSKKCDRQWGVRFMRYQGSRRRHSRTFRLIFCLRARMVGPDPKSISAGVRLPKLS